MGELDDPPPLREVLGAVETGAAGGDAAFGRDVGHLGDHQARTAQRAASEVHEVPVADRPLLGRVLTHRRHDDAVGELDAARPERRERRRHRGPGVRRATGSALGESAVHLRHQERIPRLEIVVGDPLRPGHQIEDERQRFLHQVAASVLEPLQAGLGGALKLGDVDPPRRLVRHLGALRARRAAPAWCRSRSNSGPCGPHRRAARRWRDASGRSARWETAARPSDWRAAGARRDGARRAARRTRRSRPGSRGRAWHCATPPPNTRRSRCCARRRTDRRAPGTSRARSP